MKKKLRLTRGENKFVLDPAKNNQFSDEHSYRGSKKSNAKPANSGENTATGAQQNNGRTGTNVGKHRPDTTGSMVSNLDDSQTRIDSAEYKTRPGSASMNKTQEGFGIQGASRAQVIDEDPAENEEEKFMVKMFTEQGELPFEMFLLFDSDEGVTQVLSSDQPPLDQGYFTTSKNKEVLCLEDARQREGYYRMILYRKPDVKTYHPVHIMINCGGSSVARKLSKDPFVQSVEGDMLLDFGVFKCTRGSNLVPDNTFMPLGIATRSAVDSPMYMLSQIRSLINKLSESKLGVDKIFGIGRPNLGFGSSKTERFEGEDCLSVKEVKKSLEVFMISISDHILQAFKPQPDAQLVSLKKLIDVVDMWRENIHVLDEINEQEDEEEADEDYDEDFEEVEPQA